MNESRDHIYQSLPKSALPRLAPYSDQEQSMVLDDEDNVSITSSHGDAQRPVRNGKDTTSPHFGRARGYAFQNEIHPPSLFGDAPLAPANIDRSRGVHQTIAANTTPQTFFAANPSAANVKNTSVLIPIQPVAIRPVVPPLRQYLPQRHVPPPISRSILSMEGSAVKLVSEKEREEKEYEAACNKASIICCLVIVLMLLIASATAAAVLQLL